LPKRQGAENAKANKPFEERNRNPELPQESDFAFFFEEAGTSYPWRPWRHGGSMFFLD
jgi:chitodextrinase